MSYSNPTLKNPAKKFIQFNGGKGHFYYYDKEKEENIILDLPLYFIVLDELNTIKGYSEQNKSGIYSNEVHFLDEILRVRTFKGNLSITGKYENIKHEIKASGGKFAKSVYVATKFDELELCNFMFSGTSFSQWLDIRKKFDQTKHCIKISGTIEGKKGSIDYLMPVFEIVALPEKVAKKAYDMDIELQKYLKTYKAQKEDEIMEDVEAINEAFDNASIDPEDLLPEPDIKPKEDVQPEDDDLPF